jgi:hypothetical protein
MSHKPSSPAPCSFSETIFRPAAVESYVNRQRETVSLEALPARLVGSLWLMVTLLIFALVAVGAPLLLG